VDLNHLEPRPPRLRVRISGAASDLRAPQDLSWQQIVLSLRDQAAFTAYVLADPTIDLPSWKLDQLRDAWHRYHALPSIEQISRLLRTVQAHGDALEYDLAALGIDLRAYWRERRWSTLLNLIDRLPRTSHYVEAQLDDEDLAAAILDTNQAVNGRVRMSTWSHEVDLLAAIHDRLGHLIAVNTAAAGGKPPTLTPVPRPTTAMDRLRKRRRDEQHQDLVAKLLPDRIGAPDGETS
jgi:hypothetical protein